MNSESNEKIAWVREISTREFGIIIAACDRELLGKVLKYGKIEIKVSERFYGGRLVSENELRYLLEQADVLNLIGIKVIMIAEELGLIHPEAKIYFEDDKGKKIPHSQMHRFQIFY